MSSGISDGELPTEYEQTGHKEEYQDGKRRIEVTVGAVYRVLLKREEVCSVALASPNRLCVEHAEEGYEPVVAEGLAEILELARTLIPVSNQWCRDNARALRNKAGWLEGKANSLEMANKAK